MKSLETVGIGWFDNQTMDQIERCGMRLALIK